MLRRIEKRINGGRVGKKGTCVVSGDPLPAAVTGGGLRGHVGHDLGPG